MLLIINLVDYSLRRTFWLNIVKYLEMIVWQRRGFPCGTVIRKDLRNCPVFNDELELREREFGISGLFVSRIQAFWLSACCCHCQDFRISQFKRRSHVSRDYLMEILLRMAFVVAGTEWCWRRKKKMPWPSKTWKSCVLKSIFAS